MKRNRTSFINFAHIVSNIVQFKMEIQDSFIQLVEESIRANWDRDALTDYKGATLQYKRRSQKNRENAYPVRTCRNQKRG